MAYWGFLCPDGIVRQIRSNLFDIIKFKGQLQYVSYNKNLLTLDVLRRVEILNENIWVPFPSVYVITKEDESITFCLVSKGPTPVRANGIDRKLLKAADRHHILTDYFILD